MTDLLNLPERTAKPRQQGITHVLDRGLSVAEVEGLIEVVGASIDLVKLGWGTALATENLEAKLSCYRRHGIPAVLGGTLTELAIKPKKAECDSLSVPPARPSNNKKMPLRTRRSCTPAKRGLFEAMTGGGAVIVSEFVAQLRSSACMVQ